MEKSIDEQIKEYEEEIARYKVLVNQAHVGYHILVKEQGEVERKLFKAQYEKRNPSR